MKYQKNLGKICKMPKCNRNAKVKGLCYQCYNSQLRKKRNKATR